MANGRNRAGRGDEVKAEDDVRGDKGSDYDQEISVLKPPEEDHPNIPGID